MVTHRSMQPRLLPSASDLCRTMQTSRQWRQLAGNETLWRALALRDFPRLNSILAAASAVAPSFRELYREQLVAQRIAVNRPIVRTYTPHTALSEYTLTVEIYNLKPYAGSRDAIDQAVPAFCWSGPLASLDGNDSWMDFQLWSKEEAPAFVREAFA